jgi:VanZ family protein
MQWFLRAVCVGYLVFLSMLLLTPDPARLIGVQGRLPWVLETLRCAAHAISFAVLAVLALTPRWPVPRWSIVATMVVYGGMTEILQHFVPPRTPRWTDWFQDLGGIAIGMASCWVAAVLVGVLTRRPVGQELLTPGSSDDWEALQAAVRSPAPSKEH